MYMYISRETTPKEECAKSKVSIAERIFKMQNRLDESRYSCRGSRSEGASGYGSPKGKTFA